MRDVAAVIDLGGDDTYYEGTVGAGAARAGGDRSGRQRRLSRQQAGHSGRGRPGRLDAVGPGRQRRLSRPRTWPRARRLAGVGILIDYAGNDRYRGIRRVQGQALGGVGILIDRAGNDDYHGAMWAQGMGGPLGFGVLDDLDGRRPLLLRRHVARFVLPRNARLRRLGPGRRRRNPPGGRRRHRRDPRRRRRRRLRVRLPLPRRRLLVRPGLRPRFRRQRPAPDHPQRPTTAARARRRSFQRFGCGWGCHYALGFCFDDAGDDVYDGTIMGTGMAWDCSMGVLCDFAGNDHYKATGGLDPGHRRPDGLRHPLRLRRRRRLRGLRPGLRLARHLLPRPARVRRQFQLRRRLRRQRHLRLRRREQQLHPARRLGRIPDRPARDATKPNRPRRLRRRTGKAGS